MEIFDQINFYLSTHPSALATLAFAFKVKYVILSGLAFYFIMLPIREERKRKAQNVKDKNKFLA